MALATTNPTLLDQIKRTDPDGQIADIVEALTERNPILMDATAMEGNLPTGHRTTVRSGLPTVSWRKFNQGIAASKSTTIQVDDSVGMLAGRSQVDCSLARLNANEAAFRRSEDIGQAAAMNIEMADTLFYGNVTTAPEEMHGFASRYNALSLDNVFNYFDVSGDAVGGNEQSSIWFITWHPDSCFLIYPKGSQAGMQRTDMGKQYVSDGTNDYLAWVTEYEWQIGLCIRDWRYSVRIVNIDSSSIDLTASGAALIEAAMIEGYNRIFDMTLGRTIIYMNRTVKTWLERQTLQKATMNFSNVDWHQKSILGFRGLPIVTLDALNTTEAEVT